MTDRLSIPLIENLPADELARLNKLLPWRCFVLDGHGRQFGRRASRMKRTAPQPIPDRRIELLDSRFGLSDKAVLELGCFEGIHTIALARRARSVLAVDSRIEHVVKTMVRCAFFGVHPTVVRWNVEEPPPQGIDPACDILHHVGVLYHLLDPVRHLRAILPHVRKGLMLDTHVAPEGRRLDHYDSGGQRFACYTFRESGRAEAFSGVYGKSRWLTLDDLLSILTECGFGDVEVVETRAKKLSPRVLILARRTA